MGVGIAIKHEHVGQLQRLFIDEVHADHTAGFETERCPIVDAVRPRARRHFHDQAGQLIPLPQFSPVVQQLRRTIPVAVVVFVLDQVEGGSGAQTLLSEAERDVHQVDGRILCMTGRGHHGHKPSADVPGRKQLLTRPGVFHQQVQTRLGSKASRLTGDHQLQRVPQSHVVFFLKLIKITEPSRQRRVVRERVHLGQQAEASGVELVPQNGHTAHEQFRRELVEGQVLTAHVSDSEGAVRVVLDLLQQAAFARPALRGPTAAQRQVAQPAQRLGLESHQCQSSRQEAKGER